MERMNVFRVCQGVVSRRAEVVPEAGLRRLLLAYYRVPFSSCGTIVEVLQLSVSLGVLSSASFCPRSCEGFCLVCAIGGSPGVLKEPPCPGDGLVVLLLSSCPLPLLTQRVGPLTAEPSSKDTTTIFVELCTPQFSSETDPSPLNRNSPPPPRARARARALPPATHPCYNITPTTNTTLLGTLGVCS